jgi:hypothetical protein
VPGRHRLRFVTCQPSSLLIFAAAIAVLQAASSPARADEELLRGPHPFVKNNELTLHAGYSGGLGDYVSGMRLQANYSFRTSQLIWLDLEIGGVSGSCHADAITCSKGAGNAVDVLAGAAWKYQTELPIVVHARIDGGPVFLFPDGTRSAAGFLLRASAGGYYYLYDWFGLGAEIGGAWGIGFFRTTPSHRGELGSVEATLGVALQF